MKRVEEYYPNVLHDIEEYMEIAKTENPELEIAWQSVIDLTDDQFIETATERGVARREKILKITPFADDDLESRRFRVLARENDKLPYTYRVLVNKLDQLCGKDGYVMTRNLGKHTLKIKIELTKKRMFDEVDKLARRMAPANLIITVELRYNQHLTLAKFTHAQLSQYTHKELREEVIS
ncbi:putative phage tail protein [Clostridium sp. Cult1]|uniref:putative phage tail protein n=1 Tax=Clostridium sp. Cult1 TaxID=2079002 RepID=UPI001F3B1AFD|nr:putative phage tail protein [Clostridium sp. Cult1]MCF6464214.1 hypothetical protein [Clostridium sp. Cult1]